MTGTLSPDGKWMWDGEQWIPAPPGKYDTAPQQFPEPKEEKVELSYTPTAPPSTSNASVYSFESNRPEPTKTDQYRWLAALEKSSSRATALDHRRNKTGRTHTLFKPNNIPRNYPSTAVPPRGRERRSTSPELDQTNPHVKEALATLAKRFPRNPVIQTFQA